MKGGFRLPSANAMVAAALAAALHGQGVLAKPAVPIELVQTLIEQHSLQDNMDALRDTMHQRLAHQPRYGATARLFDAATREPLRFTAPLAAFNARVARMQAQRGYSLGLLDEWRHQYGIEATCGISELTAPENIAEAIDQIRGLAEHTTSLQRRALPERRRRQLARDYPAFSRLRRDTIATALRGRERRLVRRFLKHLDRADMAAVLCAARSWMRLADQQWLEQLRTLMHAHPHSASEVILGENTPFGEIVLGGSGDGRFRIDNLLFLADLGGDDIYGIEDNGFAAEPQFVVDFSGNDRYESSRPGGYAAGLGSVAVLIDRDGDDIYAAAMHSQGAAVLGVGMLLDLAGNDRYRADSHAQGAALYGVGLLLDRGGDDRFAVRALGQGVGMPNGLGVLVDAAGDDAYVASGGTPTNYGTPGLTDAWAQGVARGVRGLAPAGIGLLADQAGHDRYDAGSFAQGGAYYRGVGQLLDLSVGNDELLGSRYSAGWGAHGGVGQFVNAAGDDRYDTRQAVAAGLAWDYSLAQFHDADGDDFYRLDGFSFGSAAHVGVGWFVDAAGNDVYVDTRSLAEAATAGPNFALFLDIGGNSSLQAEACRHRDRHGFVIWSTDPTPEMPLCPRPAEPE